MKKCNSLSGKKSRLIFSFIPLLFIILLAVLFSPTRTDAVEKDANSIPDFSAEYEAIVFGSYDGLISYEINTIAQTPDGYIWVGTYSGL